MNVVDAVQNAKPGETLTLPAGVHVGSLEITRPITIKGAGAAKTTIDAKNLGACILLNHPDAELKLVGVTLINGSSGAGGALAFLQGKRVELEDCVIDKSTCREYGGGGAFLVGPSALFTRVKIHRCVGSQGGAVLVDEECAAEFRGCLFTANSADRGGALRVTEGAKVKLVHCTLAENASPLGPEILVSGTQSRTPELSIVNSLIAPKQAKSRGVETLGKYGGTVTVAHSLLPEADREITGEGVRFGPADFFPSGQHRQKLGPSSPAAGTANPKLTPAGLTDFLGKALSRGADADMGAYAAF